MDWTNINLQTARAAVADLEWDKRYLSDIDLKRMVDAKSPAEQAEFLAKVHELDAKGGLEGYLLAQQTEILESRAWAEKQVETATLGVKGFSALLGGLLGILAIMGFSSYSDLRSSSQELEKMHSSYKTEVEQVKNSRNYLQLELAKVGQRSNRLLEVMQHIKNDEFYRPFKDLYSVLPYKAGDSSSLETWFETNGLEMIEIEQFLELDKISQKIDTEILTDEVNEKVEKEKNKNPDQTDDDIRRHVRNFSVDLESYRALINFRALRLQHDLFQLLLQWMEAEKEIGRADEAGKEAKIRSKLEKVESNWLDFDPQSYFGQDMRTKWDTATHLKSAAPKEKGGLSSHIAQSTISERQDRELWDMVTQAAILRCIVLCNVRTKLFDVALGNPIESELDRRQADIENLATQAQGILKGGYGDSHSSVGVDVTVNPKLEGVEALQNKSAIRRRICEQYCIQFYQNVIKADRALPRHGTEDKVTKEQLEALTAAIEEMEKAGKALKGQGLNQLEAYHKNVIANFRLWQSIVLFNYPPVVDQGPAHPYSSESLRARANATLQLAQDDLASGLALIPSGEPNAQGNRNILLRLTQAEVQISELYMLTLHEGREASAREAAEDMAKDATKKMLDLYQKILNSIRDLGGTDVGATYLRGKEPNEVKMQRFKWFYDIVKWRAGSTPEELGYLEKLGIQEKGPAKL